jgi:AmiR/NasT family two-component response regulator
MRELEQAGRRFRSLPLLQRELATAQEDFLMRRVLERQYVITFLFSHVLGERSSL